MTRSGFPISPPVPPGQRELQAPSQAHTFANCRQSVPKARGWMPLTKRCEPQAEPAPLSLPRERRFSWRSGGPALSPSAPAKGCPGPASDFSGFKPVLSTLHRSQESIIHPLPQLASATDQCRYICLPMHTMLHPLIHSVGDQTLKTPAGVSVSSCR